MEKVILECSQRLANAIVTQAANDYIWALKALKEHELAELYAKLEPLTRRLSEIHQLVLDYSIRIVVDGERFIVIEYFVNHTPRAEIVNNDFYERSWVYRVIKKYQML